MIIDNAAAKLLSNVVRVWIVLSDRIESQCIGVARKKWWKQSEFIRNQTRRSKRIIQTYIKVTKILMPGKGNGTLVSVKFRFQFSLFSCSRQKAYSHIGCSLCLAYSFASNWCFFSTLFSAATFTTLFYILYSVRFSLPSDLSACVRPFYLLYFFHMQEMRLQLNGRRYSAFFYSNILRKFNRICSKNLVSPEKSHFLFLIPEPKREWRS